MTLARAVMFNPNTRKEKAEKSSPKSSRRYAPSPDPEPTPTRSTYGNIPIINIMIEFLFAPYLLYSMKISATIYKQNYTDFASS